MKYVNSSDGIQFEYISKKDTILQLTKGSFRKINAIVAFPEYAATYFQIEDYKSVDSVEMNKRINNGGDNRDIIYRKECFYFKPLNNKWIEEKHYLKTYTINGKTKFKSNGYFKEDVGEYFINEFYFDKSNLTQETDFYSSDEIANQSFDTNNSFGFPENIETDYWKTHPFLKDTTERRLIINSLIDK